MKNLVRILASAAPAMVFAGIFWISTPVSAQSCITQPASYWVTYPMDPYTMNGAEDSIAVGDPLGGWSRDSIFLRAFDCGSSNEIAHGDATPNQAAVSGLTYTEDGISYPVYPTGVSGIGYVLGIREDRIPTFSTLNALSTRFYATNTPVSFVTLHVRMRFIATGSLKTGNYAIASQSLTPAKVSVSTSANTSLGTASLYFGGATFTITSRACQLTSQANTTVNLPAISAGEFTGVGSESTGSAPFTLSLNCPAGVSVHATMTDVTNPANTGSILSMTRDSTAKGVGLVLYKLQDTDPVKYGPDSSAQGNTNQWPVGNDPSASGSVSIPFTVRYIKTASPVTPGSVRAASTITFSYQ